MKSLPKTSHWSTKMFDRDVEVKTIKSNYYLLNYLVNHPPYIVKKMLHITYKENRPLTTLADLTRDYNNLSSISKSKYMIYQSIILIQQNKQS